MSEINTNSTNTYSSPVPYLVNYCFIFKTRFKAENSFWSVRPYFAIGYYICQLHGGTFSGIHFEHEQIGSSQKKMLSTYLCETKFKCVLSWNIWPIDLSKKEYELNYRLKMFFQGLQQRDFLELIAQLRLTILDIVLVDSKSVYWLCLPIDVANLWKLLKPAITRSR